MPDIKVKKNLTKYKKHEILFSCNTNTFLKNKIRLSMHGNFPHINYDSKKPHLVKDTLTEPAGICAIAGKWGKLTCHSCGLIPLC